MESSLFFGNGINRLSSKNVSWSELLNTIKKGHFEDDHLPNTMIYERIILERDLVRGNILSAEYVVKEQIAQAMANTEPNDLYRELFNLDFTNFMTTNYDYAFLESLSSSKGDYFSIEDSSSEDLYSIRRSKRILNQKEKKKQLWQIHGEIGRPESIMLGLDHYCGSVGKIDSYIKGGYKFSRDGHDIAEISIEGKFINDSFSHTSWIELFFTSDIHIIGFTFDFSEIDLWWILNKRARMMKSKSIGGRIMNRVIYYCSEIHSQKRELLESMSVIVVEIPLGKVRNKYYGHYFDLLQKLQKSNI